MFRRSGGRAASHLRSVRRLQPASARPFTRIPYNEAMENYGSDKPDLRIDLRVQDVTAVWAAAALSPLRGQSGEGREGHASSTRPGSLVDKTLADVETVSGGKAYWFRMDENGEL